MDRAGWKPFLKRWSEEWYRANPDECPDGQVPPDAWLGFPPASPDEVADLERRLGRRLPPSYREFLLVTNGWRHAGPFVWRLSNTSEIGWMRDLEPDFVDGDVEYPIGDPEEDLLARALLISAEADVGYVFLDPDDVDERGEWAAYDWFSWTAMPPERSDSFYDKMCEYYNNFRKHPEA
jgi:hypothetical protein